MGAWGQLIQQASAFSTTPAAVIAAIMEIESGGRPNEQSAMNRDRNGRPIGRAQGLMQVMPFHFGVRLGADGEASQSDQAMMRDPSRNVFKGAGILADNLRKYGAWTKAAAAYFGAIDANGNITGGTDVGGVSGNQYVNLFVAALRKYGGGNIPNLAAGGIIRSRPGGMPAIIGEGPYDEAVIPLPPQWRTSSGRHDVLEIVLRDPVTDAVAERIYVRGQNIHFSRGGTTPWSS